MGLDPDRPEQGIETTEGEPPTIEDLAASQRDRDDQAARERFSRNESGQSADGRDASAVRELLDTQMDTHVDAQRESTKERASAEERERERQEQAEKRVEQAPESSGEGPGSKQPQDDTTNEEDDADDGVRLPKSLQDDIFLKEFLAKEPSQQMKDLVVIAMKQGVRRAIDVAKLSKDPYVLDLFHDRLVDELHDHMVKTKRLPKE